MRQQAIPGLVKEGAFDKNNDIMPGDEVDTDEEV